MVITIFTFLFIPILILDIFSAYFTCLGLNPHVFTCKSAGAPPYISALQKETNSKTTMASQVQSPDIC